MAGENTLATKRQSLFSRLFPILVVALAASVLLAISFWPETRTDSSSLSMIKMATYIVAFVLLLVWALRKSGLRRRVVWLAVFLLVGIPNMIWKPASMNGKFFPIFVKRDWVADLFFGGSPDTVLEKHRQEQGKAGILADLTVQPGDCPEFRGPNRDGVFAGQSLARDWKAHPPREIWRQPVGGGYAAFSYANGFLVTIEQRRTQEVVACYEAATGKEVWTTAWDGRFSEPVGGVGPRATPTISNGDVFAYGANGRLACLDGKDGQEKWHVETLDANKNIRWGISGSPLIIDDLVIVNPGAQVSEARGTAVRAYKRATGEIVWQSGDHASSYSSPQLSVLGGVRQIVIFDAQGVAGLDPANGKQFWRSPWKTDYDINVAQPIVVGDHTIAIASGYNHGGSLLSVTQENGVWKVAELWKTKRSTMRYKFSSGVLRKDSKGRYAYGLNDGKLECVNLGTGEEVWKDESPAREGEGFGFGQLLLADDLLLVLTEETGELVMVEATPERFNELGRIKALKRGPKNWNTPTLAHGRIYLRNEEEMVCYDLSGK